MHRQVVTELLRSGRWDLARVVAFWGKTKTVPLPSSLQPYADLALPFEGKLFAYGPDDRVYLSFPSSQQRELFRRKNRRHFSDNELYQADRRFYDLQRATHLSKPTDQILWGMIA